jgi:hypothetical protein
MGLILPDSTMQDIKSKPIGSEFFIGMYGNFDELYTKTQSNKEEYIYCNAPGSFPEILLQCMSEWELNKVLELHYMGWFSRRLVKLLAIRPKSFKHPVLDVGVKDFETETAESERNKIEVVPYKFPA